MINLEPLTWLLTIILLPELQFSKELTLYINLITLWKIVSSKTKVYMLI